MSKHVIVSDFVREQEDFSPFYILRIDDEITEDGNMVTIKGQIVSTAFEYSTMINMLKRFSK